MKAKQITFWATAATFLGYAGVALAANITLVNPLCPTANAAGCVNNVMSLINQVSTVLTSIIGSIAVIVFVWAGILFVTSAGDAAKVTQARHAAIYAFIGLAIALAGRGLIAVVTAVIGSPPAGP